MRRRQAGFTLLEVLVAFIIAGFALAALYRGAFGGLLSARVATRYEEAISRAQSRMAGMGRGSPLVPGEQSGPDGNGFSFHTRVAAAASGPASPGDPVPVPTLFSVQVSISWVDGSASRQVELDSQRVGLQMPAGP